MAPFNFLGNIIWLIFGGLISALIYFACGILFTLTIIGIPFGIQCFKIAGLVLAPFGRAVIIQVAWPFSSISYGFSVVVYGLPLRILCSAYYCI